MKKLLMFLSVVSVQLYGKPVGLANCGNTCFQNGLIQLLYQIDPLIKIFSKPQDLYMMPNALGYTFQRLVWDIRKAQKDNKSSSIACEFQGNPTNLKKLTEGVYSCMNKGVGTQQDLGFAFVEVMIQLGKTFSEELTSILNVLLESTISAPGHFSSTEKELMSPFFRLIAGTGNIGNDISEQFGSKGLLDYSDDPLTGVQYEVFKTFKFLSVPKFLVFRNDSSGEPTNFPDELNLSPYIEGHPQAVYQLRAITVRIGFGPESGHYIAVVRDRDGNLYICNDRSIKQVNSWQEESIGASNLFLYVLKTTTNVAENLMDKLIKLEQSLQNLKLVLAK